MERKTVLVIGSLNYDVFLDVERMPQKGETYTAQSMHVNGGGKGANQAVQCAKLELPTVLVGAVGRDAMGDFLLEGVSQYGVNMEQIKRVDAPSGFAAVHVLEDGNVHATIVKGANEWITIADVDRVKPLMETAYAVVLQMEIPIPVVEYAIHAAALCGARVILNAAPAKPISDEAVQQCDTFMVNEVEAGFYAGCQVSTVAQAKQTIVQLWKRYKTRMIFTLGEKGALICDGGIPIYVPACKTNAVETTGAGDSFVGGFLKAQIEGYGFEESVRFAARCSAETVAHIGGQSSMPTLAKVAKHLGKNENA